MSIKFICMILSILTSVTMIKKMSSANRIHYHPFYLRYLDFEFAPSRFLKNHLFQVLSLAYFFQYSVNNKMDRSSASLTPFLGIRHLQNGLFLLPFVVLLTDYDADFYLGNSDRRASLPVVEVVLQKLAPAPVFRSQCFVVQTYVVTLLHSPPRLLLSFVK